MTASVSTRGISRSPRAVESAVERVYLVVIALAALFVAYLGFAVPKRMDESFTWAALPPLHARFVASLYLFGAVYVAGCALSSRRAVNGPVFGGIIAFTGLLLSVTLLNLDAFDFDLVPVWVWTGSYVVYPILGLLIVGYGWRRGRFAVVEDTRSGGVPRWMTLGMQATAVAFAVTGALLLVARGAMADVWPWQISIGLAQFYGAPFLAIAWCAWRYSTRRSSSSLQAFGPAIAALGIATVASSLRHNKVFGGADASSIVWYLAFTALAVLGVVISWTAWSRPSRRA